MDAKQNYPFDPADNKLIASFTSYMMKVVTTAKIDYVRRQNHWRMEMPMDKLPEAYGIPADAERWQNAVSENEFDFAEERISDALFGLPHMRRRILELSFAEGMTALEIAELLGCSIKFVYNERHAALKKLRDLLLRGGDADE
jgi:RNA polymerase sigma factor (sigma-70 family)